MEYSCPSFFFQLTHGEFHVLILLVREGSWRNCCVSRKRMHGVHAVVVVISQVVRNVSRRGSAKTSSRKALRVAGACNTLNTDRVPARRQRIARDSTACRREGRALGAAWWHGDGSTGGDVVLDLVQCQLRTDATRWWDCRRRVERLERYNICHGGNGLEFRSCRDILLDRPVYETDWNKKIMFESIDNKSEIIWKNVCEIARNDMNDVLGLGGVVFNSLVGALLGNGTVLLLVVCGHGREFTARLLALT